LRRSCGGVRHDHAADATPRAPCRGFVGGA
jgi:hypothetical protein